MTGQETGWGFAAGAGGLPSGGLTLLRTVDGGANWIAAGPAGLPARGNWTAGFLGSAGAQFVFLQNRPSLTYRTADAGATWIPGGQAGHSEDGNIQVDVVSTDTAFFLAGAAGNARPLFGDLYRTTDGGKQWTKVSAPEPGRKPYAGCIGFSSAAVGWTTTGDLGGGIGEPATYGPAPSIMVTTDGGSTWSIAALPGTLGKRPSLGCPHAVPGAVLLPVITDTTTPAFALLTAGGDRSWRETAPVALPAKAAVTFDAVNAQIAVFADGVNLHVTRNGGQSWAVVATRLRLSNVVQLDFVTAEVGWLLLNATPGAAGAHYALYRTTDGGSTWQPVASRITTNP